MANMNRAQFKRELQEGLNTVFGMEYKRYTEEWRPMYNVETSRKAYEEDVLVAGLGAAPVKPEGAGNSRLKSAVKRWTNADISSLNDAFLKKQVRRILEEIEKAKN